MIHTIINSTDLRLSSAWLYRLITLALVAITTACVSSGPIDTSPRLEYLHQGYAADEAPHTLMMKPVAEGVITSGHGYRLSPTGMPLPRKHKGVDYAAPAGTPVFAAGDGVIEKRYVSDS